eukprot:SAG22_NODE_4192_length_1352_cov_1.737430_1_plen_242_part_10
MKFEDGFKYPKVDVTRPPGCPYELRIVVYTGKDLPCQDWISSQNDAYVSCELLGQCDDDNGEDFYMRKETDVHWRCQAQEDGRCKLFPPTVGHCKNCCANHFCCCCCRCWCKRKCCPKCVRQANCWAVSEDSEQVTGASWNWRMKFDLELPMRDCHMSVKCWDKDMINLGMSGDEADMIGTWSDNCTDLDRRAGFEPIMEFFDAAEKEVTDSGNERLAVLRFLPSLPSPRFPPPPPPPPPPP